MGIVEEHRSDDGLLKLIVCRENDGDTGIGFEGFLWHTHADILASSSGLSEPDAIRRFVEDVLDDRAIIAISRIDGIAEDVWITDDPTSELRYQSGEETIEFRY
jgi:hypothetical protein